MDLRNGSRYRKAASGREEITMIWRYKRTVEIIEVKTKLKG